jgi:hypothetical protein
LENFIVYPKQGQEFLLRAHKFELGDKAFILYHSGEYPSDEVFLSFDDVAAIVPESPPFASEFEPFLVYLRKRDKPVSVYANAFDLKDPSRVKFYFRQFTEDEFVEVPNVYVASSEVVALFPSEGLERVRKRSIRGFPR